MLYLVLYFVCSIFYVTVFCIALDYHLLAYFRRLQVKMVLRNPTLGGIGLIVIYKIFI